MHVLRFFFQECCSFVQALESLQCLPSSPAKTSLEKMVDYVLDRLY